MSSEFDSGTSLLFASFFRRFCSREINENRYKDTPITFLNSHLAAFTSQTQQRNAQFRDIISQLLFPFVEGEARDPWTPNLHLSETAERPAGEGWSVGETGVLVWLGDLNYRIELPRKEVTRMISQKDYETLLRFDQVSVCIRLDLRNRN